MPDSGKIADRTGELLGIGAETLTLLLVDGDPGCSHILSAALSHADEEGVVVEQVLDLKSARDRCSGTPEIDVIIFSLEDQPGHDFSAALEMLHTCPDIALIVMTPAGYERLALETTNHGALDVLTHEDMRPDVFLWRIRHALEQHRMRQSLESHIRALEVTNGRFLSLVADNADAIVVVDRIGVVRFVNPSAERLLRCSSQQLMGQMFGVPLEGVDMTEVDLTNRPGGTRTAEIRVTPTLWDGERASIVTMRDITGRKKIELSLKLAKQAAEQANAMKSQFLASMSHELRTPLNAIVGYSEMMMMDIGGKLGSDRFREYVEDIHKGGKHLLSLINDLLDMAKAESGKLELTEDNFDLVQLLGAVGEIISGQAIAKGVSFDYRSTIPGVWMRGDERMLKQVVLNVVSNAIKFTRPGGLVTLKLERAQSGDVHIVTTDTGIGMPKHEIPRAFAAFVQIDNAYSKEANHGTGLGLALSKRFVELHQGRIMLDSEVDIGTTVTIALPRDRLIPITVEGREIVSSLEDIKKIKARSR